MKYVLASLIVFLSTFGFASAADILTDYSTGLQACWDLDEESGTRFDATANNNDLTDNNTVLFGTGVIDNAADFERANSEYLSITNAAQTGLGFTGDITLSAWVNVESAPSGGGNYFIMGKYTGGSAETYALAYRDSGGLKIDWQTNSSGGSTGGNQCQWAVNLGTATYHHLFLFSDASATTAELWVDGVSQGVVDCGTETSVGTNSAPFRIGATGNPANYFDGLVDIAVAWSGDRSANVSGVYNAGAGIACVAPPAPASFGDIIFFE